jgi:hypothetical protein
VVAPWQRRGRWCEDALAGGGGHNKRDDHQQWCWENASSTTRSCRCPYNCNASAPRRGRGSKGKEDGGGRTMMKTKAVRTKLWKPAAEIETKDSIFPFYFAIKIIVSL